MELQWPLIVFTSLVAWSAGLFGTQALLAWRGEAKRSQIASWIVAAALLVLSGIAVFLHLQHWERIFNGFGHITSGITQELVVIVALVVVAVIYLVMLRKSDDGGSVPKWCSALAVVVSVVLVAVVAHSYTMAARPAWNSVLWILAVMGEACVLGPVTLAVIMAVRGDIPSQQGVAVGGVIGLAAVIGAVVNVAASAAFAAFIQMSGSAFYEVGMYFDPTHPTKAMVDAAGSVASAGPLFWIGSVVVGALVPLACVLLTKRRNNAGAWKLWGAVALVAAVAGTVCLRVAFYQVGLSVFMFY